MTRPGLPGGWTPWQVLATAMLLLIGLLARGRLLDPRRFRARDVWRPAVTLPAAMVFGAGGVLAGFNPLGGLIAASVLLYVLIQLSPRPEPIGRGRASSWAWGVPIVLLVAGHDRAGGVGGLARAPRPRGAAAPGGRGRGVMAEHRRRVGGEAGIWSPFRSLLTAQVLSAALGLVFWVIVARLVDAHDVGVAAAAISAQTLLGIVTVLGCSTMLDLGAAQGGARPAAHDGAALAAGRVRVVGARRRAWWWRSRRCCPSNLEQALGNPIGAVTFVLGTAAFAWALVVDDACLGVKRSGLQVWRNLVASSLRFPITVVLLLLGFTDAHVLQVCWVLPLLASIPFTLWRLRLPRSDATSPPLLADVRGFIGLALRNHALSLALAAASQMVPVVAALTLGSVENAEFAIAWLMATFVFLPPYLLATALFAHGANVTEEEFRRSMERTIPAALSLSALLCVGAWVLGEPVLLIFGGEYSRHSWAILALLVPAGLWMVLKDHLVTLWRSQRQFALATRLAGAALVIEIAGAMTGGIIGGARGLCIGWLIAMGVEMALGLPWLRRAFGGLHWRLAAARASPYPSSAGRRCRWSSGPRWSWPSAASGSGPPPVASPDTGTSTADGLPEPGAPVPTCEPSASYRGPKIDLNVQSATGDPAHPIRTYDEVRGLVALAKAAGAQVISTTTSFRTMQPVAEAADPVRLHRPHHRRGPLRRAAGPAPARRDAALGPGRPAVRSDSRRAATPSCRPGQTSSPA